MRRLPAFNEPATFKDVLWFLATWMLPMMMLGAIVAWALVGLDS